MEKILRIEEQTFSVKNSSGYTLSYDGYYVITDKQTIKFGIENMQNCCERWGYLTTNDDLSEFEGASLLGVKVVDTALNEKKISDLELYEEETDTMFVNFETDKGTLQFVAYNQHNGYYGHDVLLLSEQLTENKRL